MHLFRPFAAMPPVFNTQYRCISYALAGKAESLENSGKVFLPPSALHILDQMSINGPMQFEITASSGLKTHCGVLEFSSPEGVIYMPFWMMEQIAAAEESYIRIRSITLPQGTFVKLQPTDPTFLKTSNPKAILENALRNWSTLTQDEVISIRYNNKRYQLKVLEVKPDNTQKAISIIDSDVQTEFLASPEELEAAKEQERQRALQPAATSNQSKGFVFGANTKQPPKEEKKAPEPEAEEKKPTFFSGTGYRIKDSTPSAGNNNNTTSSSSSSSNTNTNNRTGGNQTNVGRGANDKGKEKMEVDEDVYKNQEKQRREEMQRKYKEQQEKLKQDEKNQQAEPTFVAFSGKGYSLK